MNPIKIDLNDLTDDLVEEALNHLGQCSYASPCIIGALVPADQRERLDNEHDELGDSLFRHPKIGHLVSHGFVEFLNDQQKPLAKALQKAFDGGDEAIFRETLAEVREELNADA